MFFRHKLLIFSNSLWNVMYDLLILKTLCIRHLTWQILVNSYRTHWCETIKLCKKNNWCFFFDKLMLKNGFYHFWLSKNDKSWLFSFSGVNFVFLWWQLRNSKKCSASWSTYKKYNLHNAYSWEPFCCQILVTISFSW